jgi:hypothetical protein
MKFTALLASLCITLASCAAPLTQEQHGEIHSIAVISLLRDRISLEKGGLFAGFAETVPVAGIGFDAVAENSLIECAKIARPKRTYKVIDIPKQPLMDKLYGGVLSAYNATMWRIRPDISEWVKQNPVDAIVIIREVYGQVRGGPSQYFGGVGVHQFPNQSPVAQAVFGLVIWDGKTLDEITDLSDAPSTARFQQPLDAVLADLKEGRRVPDLETVLKLLIRSGTCEMARAANL